MAYERLIKLFTSADALATSIYPDGVISDAIQGARFELAVRGGCMGGQLVLPGTVRNALKIPRDYIVRFYYDDDSTPAYSGAPSWATASLAYTGHVAGGTAKKLADNQHVYELTGYWDRLSRVKITAAASFGTTHGEGETPSEIISALLSTYITPATGITAGTITTSTATVEDLAIDETTDVLRLIEELELMASSDGQWWTAYVDQFGRFHFEPVSDATADLQAIYTVGVDAISSSEEQQTRNAANHALVVGGGVSAVHEDVTSVTAYGRARRQTLQVPELQSETDLETFATGYFAKYGAPPLAVHDLRRVHPDGDRPPLPWAGYAQYTDPSRGDILTEKLFRVSVSFDEVFDYTVDLGEPSDVPASRYSPSPLRDYLDNAFPPGGGIDGGGGTDPTPTTAIPIHGHLTIYDGGAAAGFGAGL